MTGWDVAASFAAVQRWAARRMVRWAAYRWTADPDIAAGYAEEWAAIVQERPGKILQLGTAGRFAVGAVLRAVARSANRMARRSVVVRRPSRGLVGGLAQWMAMLTVIAFGYAQRASTFHLVLLVILPVIVLKIGLPLLRKRRARKADEVGAQRNRRIP
ncbi:hypothetical protein [Micromonospora vulcania]|uniref:Uncharacterized protein n=1 Tax=Micromonospora vulcania TaxID=1441873 RepID=A0ABW1H8H9_9ACTN